MARLKQGVRVRRWSIRKGKAHEEVVHGITSLPPEKADAKRLPELVREHGGSRTICIPFGM